MSNTILLVEDSADDVVVLKRSLRKAHVANPLQVVTDGRDAIDYFSGEGRFADRTKHPLPFLVFLDLKLPRHDGFEVLTRIRQQPASSDIAVVILTGSEDGLDHQKAYALGARSYLVKPPNAEDLQRLFASIQTFWSRFSDEGPVMIRKSSP